MSSKKKEYFFTPKGTVEPYCYIQKPDYGQGSFASDRGKYKLNLTVPADEAQPLVEKIQAAFDRNYKTRLAAHKKNPPAVQRGKKPIQPREGELPFIENDDGTVTFKFSAWASYEKEGEIIPLNLKVVDARGKPIKDVPNISGGSEGKVRFSMVEYGWTASVGASIKLQLEGFMLTKLVEYAAGADDWADEVEEGGYEADESTSSSKKPKADDDWSGEESEESDSYEYANDEGGDF